MPPSSDDIADATGNWLVNHPAFSHWISVCTGATTFVISAAVPNEFFAYGVKLAMALPVGLLTGFGTSIAAWTFRKIISSKAK